MTSYITSCDSKPCSPSRKWTYFETSPRSGFRFVGGKFGVGGQLLSCPFLHTESFGTLGLLGMVVILASCQSVVPSTILLNADLGGTCRNQVAWVVVLENLQRAKVLILDSKLPIAQVRLVGWPGAEKNWLPVKCTAQWKQGFECKVSWEFCFGGVLTRRVGLPVQRMGSTREGLSWLNIMSLV